MLFVEKFTESEICDKLYYWERGGSWVLPLEILLVFIFVVESSSNKQVLDF